jgi:hypothetical protein
MTLKLLFVFIFIFLGSAIAIAQSQQQQAKIEELERRILDLENKAAKDEVSPSEDSEELIRLRMDMQLPEKLDRGFTALGPAASKVYNSRSPLTWGASGEIHYLAPDDGQRSTDLASLSPVFGFRFAKSLLFNSSFTFQRSRVDVDFAYLDFLIGETGGGLRAGNVLIPVGITNLASDPTLYPMVNRPRPETLIIPSNWHENGLIGYSRIGDFHLQMGLTNSGNVASAESANWLRSARQNGVTAKADDASYFLRLESNSGARPEPVPSKSSIGLSLYSGDWSQANSSLGRSRVSLAEIHGAVHGLGHGLGYDLADRFNAEALYVEGRMSETERIYALPAAQALGKAVRGAYVILQWDLLPPLARAANSLVEREPSATVYRALPIFISWEHTNLQADLESGVPANDHLKTNVYTIGLNYKPHPQVAVKADFAHLIDGTGNSSRTIETAVAFVF